MAKQLKYYRKAKKNEAKWKVCTQGVFEVLKSNLTGVVKMKITCFFKKTFVCFHMPL